MADYSTKCRRCNTRPSDKQTRARFRKVPGNEGWYCAACHATIIRARQPGLHPLLVPPLHSLLLTITPCTVLSQHASLSLTLLSTIAAGDAMEHQICGMVLIVFSLLSHGVCLHRIAKFSPPALSPPLPLLHYSTFLPIHVEFFQSSWIHFSFLCSFVTIVLSVISSRPLGPLLRLVLPHSVTHTDFPQWC